MKKYKINVLEIKQFRKGYSAKKWIVIDEDGNKYILKMLDHKYIKNFPFALEIQSKINDLTPKVIRDSLNNLCIINENSIFYLTEFIDEQKHMYSACEIGYILGVLHNYLSNIHSDEKIEFIQYVDNKDKIELLLNNCTDKALKKILKYKKKVLNDFDWDIDLSKLNYQIIHGDFYIDNLIFCKNKTKVIDFDQCCMFYREYELLRGFFVSLFSATHSVKHTLDLFKDYIHSYKEINNQVDAINTYKLYLYVLANSLSGMEVPKLDISFAEKRYEILKFLIKNKDDILRILEE